MVDDRTDSCHRKGERLAHLAGNERALLVLDGLEPIQSSNAFDRGKLRDPAFESFLCAMSRKSAGLCLINTREPLTDLAGRQGAMTRNLDLISPQAGRALLRTARVIGADAELEELSRQFGGNALAVSLLGAYLYEQPGHGTDPACALKQMPGAQPVDHVLVGFEQWLGESPEREVLRLLGFFDCPVDYAWLQALCAKPIVPDLTDRIVEFNEPDWDRVLARLGQFRLVQVRRNASGKPVVDAHPLIREHFAKQLREQRPEPAAWREGHRRLYEYLRDSTPDKQQPTLEDLQPLYQAVAHGGKAGLHQQTVEEVYIRRILRKDELFATKKLGAYGSDISCIASFFEEPWSYPAPGLTKEARSWLLAAAGFSLRGLGRLSESLGPLRASLEIHTAERQWTKAATNSLNLSEVDLALGDLTGALHDADRGLYFANLGADPRFRMLSRAAIADALHQSGRTQEALVLFRNCENTQAKVKDECPLLYSLRGFLYCDLLLAEPERAAWRQKISPQLAIQAAQAIAACKSVEKRAAQTLDWSEKTGDSLLATAHDHLTLGRAILYRTILTIFDPRRAISETEQAVAGLRRAGAQEFIVQGLLTRASLRSLIGHTEGAHGDLDEAQEIAERGPMRLRLADVHLHRARLFRDREELKKAREMIEQCGYWRRKGELEDAEAAAKDW